jgi:hypothetical protein
LGDFLGFHIGKSYAKDLIKDITKTLTSSSIEEDNWTLVDPIDLNKVIDYSVLKVEPKINKFWVYDELHKVLNGEVKLDYPIGGRVVVKKPSKGTYSIVNKDDYSLGEDSKLLFEEGFEGESLLVDYEREFYGKETFYVKFKRPEPLIEPNVINLVFVINPVKSVLTRKESIINNIESIIRNLYDSETTVNLGFVVNSMVDGNYRRLEFNGDYKTTNADDFLENSKDFMSSLQEDNNNKFYSTSVKVIDDYFDENVTENHIVLLTGLESGGGRNDLLNLKNKIQSKNNNKLHLVYPQCEIPALTDNCEAVPPLLEFEPTSYSIRIKVNPSGNVEGTQYNIQRSTTGDSNWLTVTQFTTQTIFIDKEKEPGTLYYYRVRAKNPYNSTSTYNTQRVRTLLP